MGSYEHKGCQGSAQGSVPPDTDFRITQNLAPTLALEDPASRGEWNKDDKQVAAQPEGDCELPMLVDPPRPARLGLLPGSRTAPSRGGGAGKAPGGTHLRSPRAWPWHCCWGHSQRYRPGRGC